MGELRQVDNAPILAELAALGLLDGPIPTGFTTYLHDSGNKILIVTLSIDRYNLDFANAQTFGISRWRHVAIGVQGSLKARLADQKRIGRKRGPGERSPVPLPDWYDLTHIVYEHPELGFNPMQTVYQAFPPPGEPYTNIAEALHLRQPA